MSEKKSVQKFRENFAIVTAFIGIILLFVSIWMTGWMIVRFVLTGLLLIAWGNLVPKTEVKAK
jgi:hypothetical protein